MDEVISRSGQFKPEDDQPLPKTSSHQRQQICDDVVKVKFGPLFQSFLLERHFQYLEVSDCSEGLPYPSVGQEGHNSSQH